ncbi:hypothetical protein T10_8135 [Trichinella papuae]|uniref:Uncharacterized protein n=1 Tax=Trichinella papuae TaxID=268474 RepID=A0A0V1MBI1_9BILA|nr:hypothetical protein T10_8135 [Trichinella papuae]
MKRYKSVLDLLLIGHFIFGYSVCVLDFIFTIDLFSNNNLKNKNRINHRLESSAKVSLQTTPYLWNKWPLNLLQYFFVLASSIFLHLPCISIKMMKIISPRFQMCIKSCID